jgi:hypothetical protein
VEHIPIQEKRLKQKLEEVYDERGTYVSKIGNKNIHHIDHNALLSTCVRSVFHHHFSGSAFSNPTSF